MVRLFMIAEESGAKRFWQKKRSQEFSSVILRFLFDILVKKYRFQDGIEWMNTEEINILGYSQLNQDLLMIPCVRGTHLTRLVS